MLWGIRLVHTGITRAFGPALRRALARSSNNRFKSFAAGVGVTTILQSSTATALLISSLTGRGMLTLSAALAILLGADVGATVVAQILVFDLSWLSPLLIIAAVGTYMAAREGFSHHIARVGLGLGLLLLALSLIVSAAAGIGEGPGLTTYIGPLQDEPLLLILIAALLTWLAHSSLAMVLLMISLAGTGLLGGPAVFALLLGINVGGAMPAVILTLRSNPLARQVTVGNLIMRTLTALLCLLAWPWAEWLLDAAGPNLERAIANLHMLFNLLLAAVFLPLVQHTAKVCEWLLPAPDARSDATKPRYLDSDSLQAPSEALSCAARETLRIGDVVLDMLTRSILVFRSNDEHLAHEISELDNQVDRLHEAVKFYLLQISREAMDADEARRHHAILTMNTNLEHIGDIIEYNLMQLALKKIRASSTFSSEGIHDIAAFHTRIAHNLRLALNVFMSGDPGLARRLLEEKAAVRRAERAAVEKHLTRLRARLPETIDSTSIHLDVIRDLSRINSHLTSVAYIVLENPAMPADAGTKTQPPDAPAPGTPHAADDGDKEKLSKPST